MYPTTMGTNGTNGYNGYKWFPMKEMSSSGSQIFVSSKEYLDCVMTKLENEYNNEMLLLRLLFHNQWCYLKERLHCHLKNLTIVSLSYSKTKTKCYNFKSLLRCRINKKFDVFRVDKHSKNYSILLFIRPLLVRLRFCRYKSYWYVKIQLLPRSDTSIAKMVLTLFEITKMDFQCSCNNPPSHPAIASDMNGVTKTSQTHTINAFSRSRQPIIAENTIRTVTESETNDICKSSFHSSSSSYNSSSIFSQLSSHPAIESNMNGVTKTSQTHTINAFSDTHKPFIAENTVSTLSESETSDICKSSLHSSSSSYNNSSSFSSQLSSSTCNLSSTSCNSSPLSVSPPSSPSSLSSVSQSRTLSSSSSPSQCSPRTTGVSMGQRSHSKIIFSDGSTQTEGKCKGTQILSPILEEKNSEIVLLKEVSSLILKLERSEGSLAVTESEHRKEVGKLLKENTLLKSKVVSLENELGSAKQNMNVTSPQLEHLSVEYDKLANDKRTSETLNKPLSSNHITSLNPLLGSSSSIPSQQTRKESRTHHTTGNVSFPHKSSSRELQSFDNEFLSPVRQRMQNLPGDTYCENNGTVSCDNVKSNRSAKYHSRWKNISSSTDNSSSEDQPKHGHGPPCDEPPSATVSHGGQDDQQFNYSQHTMKRSNGCTSTANNKANNSSNSQDSSQEAKQKSNANGMNSTGNSRPQDSNIVHEDGEAWLCHHYKRRCFVNFSCCDTTFWPCHRCHNNKSKCGVKRLKSCHTKGIKCASCGEKKEFDKNSQHCTKCHKKFAEFFCVTCKHLTGMDDNPYHCDKCGICRIRSNRSFHCDVCGVCLDVQLKDKHKCRSGSAHDECCICLEDAFSGCQILPCSHKVHKECAAKMIRSGITCCPICRESFAHKLQRKS